ELEKICLDFLGKESALRFCQPPGETPRSYGFLLIPLSGLAQGLLRIQNRLAAALGPLAEEAPGEKPGGLVYEARMILHRLGELVSISEAFQIWEERPEDIFWMERKRTRRGEEYLRLAIAPLDTRDIMRRAVFEPYKTVICTSATLSVKDSFEYWARSAGLSGWEEREVRFLRFPSPFPYRQNVLLGVPTDAPSPEERGFSPFLGEMILKSLSLSGGHGLVLFTSYSQLQETFAQIHPALEDLRIPLLKQGDDERTRLLEAFRRSSESVLFATSSFWEGVDAPGESLQMVIICRLPFQAPTDPVLSARAEALERRGGQPFWELSLPEAVMRLKQGFGRLMRSSTDRGVVLILDPRVIRKAYGGIFLESLPETRRSLKESSRLLGDIEGFLFESRG
ncbi:MAG: ATP-dependent DNA helicase, partial [Spirochaetales bacterium]|nr:ATP-dependent DNA helicase [Spirochaetales bacterium]